MKSNEVDHVLNVIEEQIKVLHGDCVRALDVINKRAKEKHVHVTNMYEVDESYLMDVSRHAWGERGKIIILCHMMSIIKRLKLDNNESKQP